MKVDLLPLQPLDTHGAPADALGDVVGVEGCRLRDALFRVEFSLESFEDVREFEFSDARREGGGVVLDLGSRSI